MSSSTGNPYSNLRFQPGVDWQHVDPRLWQILNSVLRAFGKVGTVISGYRTDQHSIQVGGFAGDPHTRRIAADVEVGGVPIGNVPGLAQALTAAGLISGAQAGFYKGQPDPGHVQLGTGTGGGGGSSSSVGSGSAGSGSGDSVGAGSAGASCLPATIALMTFLAGGLAILDRFL